MRDFLEFKEKIEFFLYNNGKDEKQIKKSERMSNL